MARSEMKTRSLLLTPNSSGARAACLAIPGKTMPGMLLVISPLASDAGVPYAQDGEAEEEAFRNHISAPIVQSHCDNCHVANGASGHTRLVFVRSSDTVDYASLNLRTFQNLLDVVQDASGGSCILSKIQGAAHGGGIGCRWESEGFRNMKRFLGLLGEAVTMSKASPETLFKTVVLAPTASAG